MRKITTRTIFAPALAALALLTGCVSWSNIREHALFVWDETLPPEETALVYLISATPVRNCNGVEIETGNQSMYTPAVLIVPGGQPTTISADFHASGYNTTYTVKDMEFTYSYQAGKAYQVFFSNEKYEDTGKKKWCLSIYEYESELDFTLYVHDEDLADRIWLDITWK